MEKATLFVEEHNLHRLKLFGNFTSCDIRVYIQDLTVWRFSKTGEDRERTSANGSLDGALVDLCDLAHETVLILVKVVCTEHA